MNKKLEYPGDIARDRSRDCPQRSVFGIIGNSHEVRPSCAHMSPLFGVGDINQAIIRCIQWFISVDICSKGLDHLRNSNKKFVDILELTMDTDVSETCLPNSNLAWFF